jgi:hypothetical protein
MCDAACKPEAPQEEEMPLMLMGLGGERSSGSDETGKPVLGAGVGQGEAYDWGSPTSGKEYADDEFGHDLHSPNSPQYDDDGDSTVSGFTDYQSDVSEYSQLRREVTMPASLTRQFYNEDFIPSTAMDVEVEEWDEEDLQHYNESLDLQSRMLLVSKTWPEDVTCDPAPITEEGEEPPPMPLHSDVKVLALRFRPYLPFSEWYTFF